MSTTTSLPPYVSVMELVALHTGKPKAHGYLAVHPALESMARAVEGSLPTAQRQRLYPFAARLAHTRATVASGDGRVLSSVRLACWAARQVLHLIATPHRASAECAIAAVKAWCEGIVKPDYGCFAATLHFRESAANERTSLLWAERAAAWVIEAVSSPRFSVYAPTLAVRFAAEAIPYYYGHEPVDVVADRLVALLAGLLDEYDCFTGREPVDLLTPDQVAALRMLAALT